MTNCGSYAQNPCPDVLGCPPNICPDALIKRHDTEPSYRVLVEDCSGPLDLTDTSLIVEVSIWAKAKLKANITADDTYFQLADNVGFEQIVVGDIIIMERVRLPEYMLVTGFDENNKLVQVERAYSGTTASTWKKGTQFRIFRTIGSPGEIETVVGDIIQLDGTTARDQIIETRLVYNWEAKDTCTPGCYWLEFKLLKMSDPLAGVDEHETISSTDIFTLSDDISNISFTPSNLVAADFGCFLGEGVEWVRRFPSNNEGFLIKIVNSFTAE